MKKIYCYLIFCFVLVILGACQNEELKPDAVGYLKLEVGTDKSTLTKAGDVYNPKQIAVKILNSAGEIIEETDDWTKWTEAAL